MVWSRGVLEMHVCACLFINLLFLYLFRYYHDSADSLGHALFYLQKHSAKPGKPFLYVFPSSLLSDIPSFASFWF